VGFRILRINVYRFQSGRDVGLAFVIGGILANAVAARCFLPLAVFIVSRVTVFDKDPADKQIGQQCYQPQNIPHSQVTLPAGWEQSETGRKFPKALIRD
jgi:hypothetical protein